MQPSGENRKEKEGNFEYRIAGLYKGGDLYERRTERAGSDRDRFDYDDHGDSVNRAVDTRADWFLRLALKKRSIENSLERNCIL